MRQMIVFEQFVEPVPEVRIADRAFTRNGGHDLSLHDNTMRSADFLAPLHRGGEGLGGLRPPSLLNDKERRCEASAMVKGRPRKFDGRARRVPLARIAPYDASHR